MMSQRWYSSYPLVDPIKLIPNREWFRNPQASFFSSFICSFYSIFPSLKCPGVLLILPGTFFIGVQKRGKRGGRKQSENTLVSYSQLLQKLFYPTTVLQFALELFSDQVFLEAINYLPFLLTLTAIPKTNYSN